MVPDWEKLKKTYADTPNVVIGECDCTSNCKGMCGEHDVRGFPTLKVLKNGQYMEYNGGRSFKDFQREVESKLDPRPACSLESKDACAPADRKILEESEKMSKAERAEKIKQVQQQVQDARKEAAALEKKAKQMEAELELIKAGGATVDKVEQLLNDADWRAHCEARTCVVAFLPHIYDDGAKGRNSHLKQLNTAMQESKKDGKNVGFLWSQGGDQFELEEALGLQFGFPAVIAVNFGKERYGVHRGTFDQVGTFLTSLSRGGVPLSPLPKNAKAVKADPWDGKDAAPPVEEDL